MTDEEKAIYSHIESLFDSKEEYQKFHFMIVGSALDGESVISVTRLGYGDSKNHRAFYLADPKCFFKLMTYCNQVGYFSRSVPKDA